MRSPVCQTNLLVVVFCTQYPIVLLEYHQKQQRIQVRVVCKKSFLTVEHETGQYV